MKGEELAKIAMQYPDFEFEFVLTDGISKFPNVRVFEKLEVGDIGHSEKVVQLCGEER